MQLKRQAAAWLAGCGCAAFALEVASPTMRHRVDVAGYFDALPKRGDARCWAGGPFAAGFGRGVEARTVLIEVKVSRADFLRDRAHPGDLRRAHQRLRILRDGVLADLRPLMAMDASRPEQLLFGHWDSDRAKQAADAAEGQDGSSVGSTCPPRTLGLIEAAEFRLARRIETGLKFATAARQQHATAMFILSPPGVLRECDTPAGWGLLVASGGVLDRRAAGTGVEVLLPAPLHHPSEQMVRKLLRNIAVAASREQRRDAAAFQVTDNGEREILPG